MKHQIFQVNSFTNKLFKGNPACVVPLKEWLSDDILLNIARENAVSETAFFIKNGCEFHLRWFTPDLEMDLCGHATLATAHIIKTELKYKSNIIHFKTLSGNLSVHFIDEFYYLNFPSRKPIKTKLPNKLKDSLNILPKEIYKSRDYMLVYESEKEIYDIQINRHKFDKINLGTGGVIFTAPGVKVDFVSRFFTPQSTILEDSVTGSSHCSLIPFWSEILNKNMLKAKQVSERGGYLLCENKDNRVIIGGQAILFSIGYFSI